MRTQQYNFFSFPTFFGNYVFIIKENNAAQLQ